jgi:Protein of unknown function (DUF3485)
MNKQKWIILLVGLGLMAGTAGLLVRLKTHQKLGAPGIIATAIPSSPRMNIYLPDFVLDYSSHRLPQDEQVLLGLPKDTSLAQERYIAPDGFVILLNVVLMGTDRTSIHKPQFCLKGSGWNIDDVESSKAIVPMQKPYPYNLPVMKLTATKEGVIEGQQVKLRGVYVYWFVADKHITETHGGRMWQQAINFLSTGEIQRWAYVTCFSTCNPGDEDATYERIKKFINAAVPQFQQVAGSPATIPVSPERASR